MCLSGGSELPGFCILALKLGLAFEVASGELSWFELELVWQIGKWWVRSKIDSNSCLQLGQRKPSGMVWSLELINGKNEVEER